MSDSQVYMYATLIIITSTSVAKAMKVLRKLGCCLQIEVRMVVNKLFCLVKSQKYRMQVRNMFTVNFMVSLSKANSWRFNRS